jgi:hypothetical protein
MRLLRFAAAVPVAVCVMATATAEGTGSPTKVTCTRHLQTVSPTTGENFGTVSCGRVFGNGVQHTPSVTVTPTSQSTATGSGSFKRFFDAGTIRGTFKITSTATPAGVVTYVGSAKISGGTGAYAHARGTAKLACESQDRGLHATCTEKLTLTKI